MGMGKEWETSPQRACKDFKEWLRNHIAVQPLSFFVPGGGTMLATLLIPSDTSVVLAALYGFIGGALGLGLLYLGIYVFQLFRAPYRQRNEARKDFDKLEKEREPQLIVDSLPKVHWYGNRLGRSWRLQIKNAGFNEAEDCRGKLVALASAIQGIDKGLGSWQTPEYLNWSTGIESIVIAPNDTMELEVVNYEGYGSPLYLAYAKGEDFRKQHALKSFKTPIILIISITSKSKPPIYCVCKFYFSRLKHIDGELVEDDDNLEVIESKSEKPDITL